MHSTSVEVITFAVQRFSRDSWSRQDGARPAWTDGDGVINCQAGEGAVALFLLQNEAASLVHDSPMWG